MAAILDGKAVAEEISREVAAEVQRLKKTGVSPCLAVLLVGDNPASQTYVRNKEAACQKVGIASRVVRLPADITQVELLHAVEELNEDEGVHGLLVQLPLPPYLDPRPVMAALRPEKDVDGFHPLNMGRLQAGEECLWPCTPHGIVQLLRRSRIPPAGRHAVVVGRSNIVGKPMALLLLQEDATVTVCHSHTPDLAALTRQAELLVVAVGRPRTITGEMVREGAVVVDVGINRVDGRLVGDVDFESVAPRAAAITPVPGGVGPMTVAMLLLNTVQAARRLAGQGLGLEGGARAYGAGAG
ncbi:MAG TPA: bifunctional methylenetetrahydrofolate dehydrogenase/methenyltetrahydrofolate cyclohydrolase FolD [Firmicutes bacterium]|nr:bifunctional methylenetetrahydrofolate dehydrogenase/methenyltetrahydrofolate cyclohydrolase FolD [Bacillota bacterium]